MKYLCLIYQNQAMIDAIPQREMDDIMSDVFAYREELRQRGYYITSSPLQPAETATTIRVRGGRLGVTDGPFAETKEQIGGFYLIEARDLNDAIRVASHMPPARFASIEIRPLNEVGHTEPRQDEARLSEAPPDATANDDSAREPTPCHGAQPQEGTRHRRRGAGRHHGETESASGHASHSLAR